MSAEPLVEPCFEPRHVSSSVHSTERFGNSAELSEGNGNSAGNSWFVLAVLLGFSAFGSDTGSRGSSLLDFSKKTGTLLTLSHVQLTNRQSAQNFGRSFFPRLKGEFKAHFRGFFGTNWDKSAGGYGPVDFERKRISCERAQKVETSCVRECSVLFLWGPRRKLSTLWK